MVQAPAQNTRRRVMIKQQMARRVDHVVIAVLLLIALAHLLRLITGVELRIGDTRIPLWISLFGCLGPATLACLCWWSRH
jgi:hypothetical protein